MKHPKAIGWEDKLKSVFDRIDDRLEERYEGRYPLHPNRPPRGTTANREMDGLFNVGAAFTAGYGSELGRGYVVEIRMATPARIPPAVREKIEEEVAGMLDEELAREFPGQALKVSRDGPVYKIHGNLSLGEK
ncbi:MAG: hypothetical protein KKC51_03535 [Verrucomicrobia bacterium]|nr:hypothetical protein [Verrucomicrobiota bacterium]